MVNQCWKVMTENARSIYLNFFNNVFLDCVCIVFKIKPGQRRHYKIIIMISWITNFKSRNELVYFCCYAVSAI